MNKLLTAFILALVLVQALLLPAIVHAEDAWVVSCPNFLTFTTLPATDIRQTTVVLNGSLSEVVHAVRLSASQEYENHWAFEYGTKPGNYTYRVNAEMDSVSVNQSVDGNKMVLSVITAFKGTATNLIPCTTYYARFRYIGNIDPRFLEIFCFEVTESREISFRTLGCEDESYGSGGMGAAAPTLRPYIPSNIVVQSATIAATKASPGENVDVAATITNRGGSNGTSKVTLFINGQEAESKGITLASGESTQVHFSVSRNEPGTYSVYINGVPAGTLTVDLFTSNDILIYTVIGLFTIGIIGVLYLVMRRRAA